jgi:hypothetical protein
VPAGGPERVSPSNFAVAFSGFETELAFATGFNEPSRITAAYPVPRVSPAPPWLCCHHPDAWQ